MANFIPLARTNYFRVKNADEFKEWASQFCLEIHDGRDDSFCLIFDEGVPSYHYDDETDEERDVYFMEELSTFLAPNEVAIVMEIGFEKMRYLTGWTTAFHADGRYIDISLNDIYNRISNEWGIPLGEISTCEY